MVRIICFYRINNQARIISVFLAFYFGLYFILTCGGGLLKVSCFFGTGRLFCLQNCSTRFSIVFCANGIMRLSFNSSIDIWQRLAVCFTFFINASLADFSYNPTLFKLSAHLSSRKIFRYTTLIQVAIFRTNKEGSPDKKPVADHCPILNFAVVTFLIKKRKIDFFNIWVIRFTLPSFRQRQPK